MKIKIIAFGYLSEIINKNIFELGDGGNVKLFKSLLEEEFPAIKKYEYKIAVNHELADDAVTLFEDSEVVLLPAFAGG